MPASSEPANFVEGFRVAEAKWTGMSGIQSMLSAESGNGRVTIGRNPLPELRTLSDQRNLTCPACGAFVVLKAGRMVAPHFAHLPGAVCSHPDSEPETPAHQSGKALLAEWLSAAIPNARVTLEAVIPETGQRADLLIEADNRRVALELQCAEITAREWLRRHRLYRSAEIQDLWLLGVCRLTRKHGGILSGDLESALTRYGAPLLFLDTEGEFAEPGSVVRFRPSKSQRSRQIPGRFSARPLFELAFPWRLLDWPLNAPIPAVSLRRPVGHIRPIGPINSNGNSKLSRWLESQYNVQPDALPSLFGIRLAGEEVFACSAALWQAAIYYRFIEGQAGSSWWMSDVETWVHRYLPLAFENRGLLLRALYSYQGILSAADLLSIPEDNGPVRVKADFSTLGRIPDAVATERLAAYCRAALWERK